MSRLGIELCNRVEWATDALELCELLHEADSLQQLHEQRARVGRIHNAQLVGISGRAILRAVNEELYASQL